MGRNSRVNVCLKIFLLIVNGFFLLIGAAVLGVGIYLCSSAELSRFNDVFAAMETLRSVRFILVGCGCGILLICLLGCIGSCREATCLLVLYVVLVSVALIASIAATVLSYTLKNEVKSFAKDHMQASMDQFYGNYTDSRGRVFTESVDKIQRNEMCCGWSDANSPRLFNDTPWFREANANRTAGQSARTIPDSCCVVTTVGDPKYLRCINSTNVAQDKSDGYIFYDNCWDRLIGVVGNFLYATIGTVIAAILLQIVCLICGIVLLCQVRRSEQDGRLV